MSTQEEDIATRSEVPDFNIDIYLADLKRELNFLVMAALADVKEFGHKEYFTQQETAALTKRSLQKVKDAIRDGELETGTSGWITMPAITKWLGVNPILARIDRVKEFNRRAIELTRMTEELFPKPSKKI